MSILRRFLGYGPRRSPPAGLKQACIVDASGFIEKRHREAGGQPSPRDNFFALKNLAHFAQREEIEMTAVFMGRPLREAAEGDSFRGVVVRYAEDEKGLAGKVKELVRAASKKNVLVITDDRHIEQETAKTGAQYMRLATLRKCLEGGFEQQDHPPRHFQKRPAVEPEQPPAEEKAPPPPSEEKTEKNVLDLIDPI